MSADDDARDFLGTLAVAADDPARYTPSQDRPARLGTVQTISATTGLATVLFDGETAAGTRGYVTIAPGTAVADRVVLLPIGRTYVIVGRTSGPARGAIVDYGKIAFATTTTTGTTAINLGAALALPSLPYATTVLLTFVGLYNSQTTTDRSVFLDWAATVGALTNDAVNGFDLPSSTGINPIAVSASGDLVLAAAAAATSVQFRATQSVATAGRMFAGAWRWQRVAT